MRYVDGTIKNMSESPEGTEITVMVQDRIAPLVEKRECQEIQIGIDDGRTITPAQRRKAYATLRDISEYTGYTVEAAKEIMKVEHMLRVGDNLPISLASCTITDAREYINTLMEYALREGIILTESGLMRTDDIDRYLIQCIRYRRCCICGRPADIHHVDAIGMGRNRQQVDDSENEIAALCRNHHMIAHQRGWDWFQNQYKVYGIPRCRVDLEINKREEAKEDEDHV